MIDCKEETQEPIHNAFHDHLDACRQCADQPFNLCPDGEIIIRKTAEDMTEPLPGFDGWL